jgi:hypothetical protein
LEFLCARFKTPGRDIHATAKQRAYTEIPWTNGLPVMGQITTRETLALRWTQLCNDALLNSFPGKVELNGYGVIELRG